MEQTRHLSEARAAARKLLAYCRDHDWSGYDPYDALNSRVTSALPVLNSRVPRLALTQTLKRSPVNLRRLLLVPPTQNPKALALFVSALLKRPELIAANERAAAIDGLLRRLVALRSSQSASWCWGYSFPWQTRTHLVARGAPNLVCTTFVAGALIDAWEERHERQYLNMACGAAEYILNELYRTDGSSAGFSYPLPAMTAQIHNANFLGSALFARIYRLTGEKRFLEPALKVARYSASRQRPDGSWTYGEAATQQWIDNFHSGYNLCALSDISRYLSTDEFQRHLDRGVEFYRNHFVRDDGAPRYFSTGTYPIDIHCAAQSIITLLAFREHHPHHPGKAHSVLRWALDHMWDDRGFFYYRVLRFGTIKTPYMRWSQAWMLLALATLLNAEEPARHDGSSPPADAAAVHTFG